MDQLMQTSTEKSWISNEWLNANINGKIKEGMSGSVMNQLMDQVMNGSVDANMNGEVMNK